MAAKVGRVVYSFLPAAERLDNIAIPSGPRPILLSYYLLRKEKGDPLSLLRRWREYSQPWPLIIDSGVYSLRKELGVNSTAARSNILRELGKSDWEKIRKAALQQKGRIDDYVKSYIAFLKEADGLFDVGIEMDLDYEFGIEYADAYYQEIIAKISPHKIMRIWHHEQRTFEDWIGWVNDVNQSYLGLEGGTVLSRDENLYNRFILPAIEKKKKVHVLAITTPKFLRNVPCTTADSSTFVNAGRFGTVKVPGLGEICFSQKTDLSKPSTLRHYVSLSKQDLEACEEYFSQYGFSLNDITQDGTQGFYNRTIMTLFYYDNYVDRPYIEKPTRGELF